MRRVERTGGQPWRRLAAPLVIILSLGGHAAAQPALADGDRGTLRGEVLDSQGLPVPDAAVVLTLGGGGLLETTSDDAGTFLFEDLPAGTHAATAVRAGFSARTVDVVVAAAGETAVSIPLEVVFAEDVTVVGQQQERALQDTDASVVVATGARLDAGTNTDLYRLAEVTPNVGSAGGDRGFAIRGMAQTGLSARGSNLLGSGLLVSVKMDGATIQSEEATFFGPYGTWDMGQVEIFRGPQSTQQGRNSLAGAIVLESADPVYEHQVKGRISAGSRASRQTAAAVNVPIVDNRVAFRVSVDQRRQDGWVSNPTRGEDDYDARESMNVRTKVRLDPTARFRGMVTLNYTDSRGGEGVVDIERFRNAAERVNLSNGPTEEGSEHRVATVDLAYDLSRGISLESTSSVYEHEYQRINDLDQSPLPIGHVDYTTDNRWVTQELGLRFAGGDRVRGVAGFYYANLEDAGVVDAASSGTAVGLPPQVTVTGFVNVGESTENAAFFGEVDLDLADRWTLALGARYDDESRLTRTRQGLRVEPEIPSFPTPQLPEEVLDANYRVFLPKAGLTREWSPALSTTVSYQRGYRAGGRSVSFISQQVADYDPEFTDNYEFALRARSTDRRWQADANLFYIDWHDQQVSALTSLGLDIDRITVNAGASTVYGFEGRTEYWVNRNLSFYGSIGLLQTRFDEFVDGDLDLSGNEFPEAPNWSFAAGANWRIDGNWVGDLQLAAQDAAFSERENDLRFYVGRRTLLNTRVGYQHDRWGVFFFGRNLLDEAYLLHARAPTTALHLIGRVGEPRAVGVELNVGI